MKPLQSSKIPPSLGVFSNIGIKQKRVLSCKMGVWMHDNNRLLAKSLTYCGTLPLVFCIIARFLHVENIDLAFIAQTYSAIIISFLCGIHWATYLFFALGSMWQGKSK